MFCLSLYFTYLLLCEHALHVCIRFSVYYLELHALAAESIVAQNVTCVKMNTWFCSRRLFVFQFEFSLNVSGFVVYMRKILSFV